MCHFRINLTITNSYIVHICKLKSLVILVLDYTTIFNEKYRYILLMHFGQVAFYQIAVSKSRRDNTLLTVYFNIRTNDTKNSEKSRRDDTTPSLAESGWSIDSVVPYGTLTFVSLPIRRFHLRLIKCCPCGT